MGIRQEEVMEPEKGHEVLEDDDGAKLLLFLPGFSGKLKDLEHMASAISSTMTYSVCQAKL